MPFSMSSVAIITPKNPTISLKDVLSNICSHYSMPPPSCERIDTPKQKPPRRVVFELEYTLFF